MLEDASEIAREYLIARVVELHGQLGDSHDVQAAADGILNVEQTTVEVRIDLDKVDDSVSQALAGQRLPVSDRDLARQFDLLNATLGNGLLRRSLHELAAADRRDAALRRLQAELLAMFQNYALDVSEEVQREARDLIARWHDTYVAAVEALPDSERTRLNGLFAEPGTAIRRRGGSKRVLPDVITTRNPADGAPTFERHVYTAGGASTVQLDLNGWERHAVETSLTDPTVLAWLRNERTSGRWRLAVPYKMHGEDALMYPDLLLIRREPDRLRVDVIDPHGLHLEDALEKLQGLARFAQTHREGVLGRVMAIAEIDGRRCERDLSDPDIAQAALACLNDTDARRFFAPDRSPMAAVPYEPPLENRDDPSALTTH